MTQKMTLLLSLLAIIGSLSNADISVKNKLNQVSIQNYVREPSEWKYRVVYQLLTDRFSHGENDPTTECVDLRGWCGGTFAGIKTKLDYLEHLGIDAIWISPMVKNTYLGYHGYWAENIYEVEPHFGSKDELIDLITECHKRDIWVMLDVVPNHMGYPPDCFWDECNEPEDFSELFPFDKKDYYHNLCMIKDFDNQTEVELCRLAWLPDLNQENEEVKNILYNWISELTDVYQFDGYRIDTARHISKDFWPGFEEAAGTYVIGEISVDEDHVEYLADYQNVMSGVLNFPTYYSLRRVFAEGFPMNYLYENILEQRKHYKDVKLTGTFVDNHDQNRFLNLTNQNLGKLKNSLAFILFGDGIPIIYSGTELEFHGGYDPNNRESMWPHFDEEGEIFQFISQSNRFRKSYLNVVVDSQQNEIYIDDKTYIFEKGNFSLIVAVTSAEKDEGSYSLILSDLPINDLTQFCNVYTNETLQVIDGSLNLTFNSMSSATQTMDVLEKEDVLLECRFPTRITDREIILYWIRSNRNGHDNVAIGNLILENNYSVRHRPVNGTYDLRITNATYDRDNGQFECRLKEGGTGRVLHSKSIDLTVLLEPSKPIITPSAVTTATERKPLNLTCSSVGGSPPPQIKWYSLGNEQQLDATIIRGKNKDEPTKSILSITPTRKDDGASYRCTVWNRALRQQHNLHTDTKLFVNYFPRVTVGPANPLKVKVDETARFECLVDAKPSVTSVKWTRKKRFIETNFKHTIPKVRLEDAGSYICSADNGLGEVGKNELILDVLYPPVITIPEEKVVHAGDEVVVECQVASNPKPTSVQWLKEGDSSFHQAGNTLRIRSVSAKDNGKYICSSSNFIEPTGGPRVMHKGNATMNIHVHHKPGKAYIIPSSRVAIDGKRISLTCGANPPGYPEPEYKWWKEGSEATLTTGKKFTINPARLSNAGQYHCRATNQFGGSKIADFDLKVYQSPRILTPLPASMKKNEGDMGYSLSCSATGKPRPVVTWFKNGKVINVAKSHEYEISIAEKEALVNGASTVQSSLLFKGPERLGTNKLMPTDRGHYTCQFHNDVKSTDSSMLLKIEHAPIFLHNHNKVAYDIGETAYLTCRTQAFPKPQLSWYFQNNIIRNDRYGVYEKNFTQLREDIYQGVLKIYKIQQSSYGDYKCKGRNKMGDKTTIIRLQQKGKPEMPMNLNVKEVGYNYITIGFSRGFDGGYSNTKFTVQYQQQHFRNPLYADCGPLSICNITRLDQNTVYSFRVKASNERGESKYSDEILMSTRIDVNQIPMPENVHYERSTSVASFNLAQTQLQLIARIELENNDGSWSQYDAIPVKDTPFSEMIRNNVSVKNLRVRFCLETNHELCGSYTDALVVDMKPNALKAAFKEPWVIGLIVVIILLALVAMLILIKCCFYKNAKTIKTNTLPTSNGKATVVHNSSQAPPPYTSLGIENKGVDTLKDASNDNLKANIYSAQNGYTTYHSNGQVTYPDPPNSNTNSANGGSVNSQDSLWNVKNNGNNDVFNQQQQSQQMLQQQMSTYGQNGHLHYDNQTQQPMQTHVLANGFVGSEDYTHYPYPDEYLTDRNCQYLLGQNADQYPSSINKSQALNGIDPEYSPYGDVNGLPNPYHDSSLNHIGDLSLGQQSNHSHGHPAVLHQHHHPLQQMQQQQPQSLQHQQQQMHKMSFDEQIGESGITTPSSKGRRVIREIIV